MQVTWVQFLDWKDPLEKETATHSSILAWEIPWTEELGRLSPWSLRGSDVTERTRACTHTHSNILFHILFHYGVSQDIVYSFLCYTVGTC